MCKKIIIASIFFLTASLVQAHEFWLLPQKFQFSLGETMEFDFMVGENFEGQFWELKKQKFAKLDHHTTGKSESLLNLIQEGKGKKISLVLEQEGTHLFAMQSNNSLIKLDGENFNAYLKEDGLDEILEHRTKTNTLADSARENFARCAKLLVQAGEKTDDTYQKVVGLSYEIVPLSNPYNIKKGDELKFKVLFQGKPASFVKVKVWNRGEGKTFVQTSYTEKDGTLTTRLSNSGTWMISSVKMIPSKQKSADWQSFWATLVFGL
ncbi:MAG TPA: DUF4198 domain-containing protein [Cyclobacteriaceae bacterium]